MIISYLNKYLNKYKKKFFMVSGFRGILPKWILYLQWLHGLKILRGFMLIIDVKTLETIRPTNMFSIINK